MQESTRIVRSTLTPVVAGTEMHSGPVFAAPYHAPGDPAGMPYTYARSHNPTWTELERVIANMESGVTASGEAYEAQAVVFASGMGAIAAVFGAVLRPGDAIVIPANSYYTARVLLREYFTQMGIEVRTVAAMGVDAVEAVTPLLAGAKLLWIESPSNPTMDVCDIAALCDAARAAGVLVAVDNTTPTALGQKPLALGADFSAASDTKSMTGHGDILLGHVAVRDAVLLAKIDQWRTLTGGILGPMEAWLALRSIPTLPLRLARTCENALAIAEFLATRSEVESVMYPGLKTHPGHAIALRQMTYFGPVVSFILKGQAAAEAFLNTAELLTDATSFGGMTTTAERRAKWGGDAVAGGFIRLSAGCEAIEDLLADLAQALDGLR
ncbi:MAG: Cys/Met metabolism pyridoxal-phosphate-dependent protein [Acidobacteriaceae bacterium]|nr:Cys/Met metabolism pyridoxal-phosphate-dependent protein [Acidobacteriaceae bacterium]